MIDSSETLRVIKRIDRKLRHHDSTLRSLYETSTAAEKEVITILENRVRRLRADVESAQILRLALKDGLSRLGVDFENTDSRLGRSLRQVLGLTRKRKDGIIPSIEPPAETTQ